MSRLRTIFFIFLLTVQGVSFAGTMQEANAALDRRDYAIAQSILDPLAMAGDVDALGTMGNIYGFGWGVAPDLKVAHDYWQRAAEKHLSTAMYNLGTLYLVGKPGFPLDDEQAAIWMKRAAEHRHIQAMLNLSSMYATGRGLSQDFESALAWASLALSNAKDPSHKAAANGQLQKLGTLVPRDRFPVVQVQIGSIAKIIDANVQAYRSQGSPQPINPPDAAR
jgi:TPR repeat protein